MVLTAGLLASCSTVNAQKGEGAKQQDAAAKVSGEKTVPGLNTKSIDSVKKDKPAAGGQSTEAQAEPLARTDRPNAALSNTIGAKLGEDIAAVIADATHVEYVDITANLPLRSKVYRVTLLPVLQNAYRCIEDPEDNIAQ